MNMATLQRFERTFLTFEGRIGRRRYLGLSLLPLVFYVLVLLYLLTIAFVPGGSFLAPFIGPLFGALFLLLAVLTIWIWLSAGVRRLHDMGLNGYPMLLHLVPFVGLLLWLVMLIWEGQYGDNKYGPQPGYEPS